ncbi:von Willebrand factor A domain-containing protein 5A [Gonapodya sp. JEL0774]|nr:von Willebrand factor A domain-containing protein 5A [Gonapodya sp. JEL0774]
MAACGLYFIQHDSAQSEQAIPLKKVAADVSIIDCIASVTLSQTYVNESPKPVEAIYKFPVYESAAVYSFEAVVDGVVIRGVCKEREEAAKEYNAAIAAGNRAFLLEEQKADIFQISVGNIPSGKPVIILISYVHECKTDEANDELRFTIPTTIASQTYGTFNPPQGTNLLAGGTTYSDSANYTLSVAIDVRTPSGPVTEVSSPSHPIKVSIDATNPHHAMAKLALETVYLDKDFILVVKSPGLDKPRLVLERDPTKGTKCCMVTFVPKFRIKEAPTEVIFVLDRSGSMDGENISFARTGLLLFLKSLPQNCKFNIVGFGSDHQLLFPKSVPYDERNLATAVAHVEKVEADLGGTEILAPLQAIVAEPVEKDWQRTIIVLTDGEVYQPESIFALAADISRTQNTRFFTLGVGDAVSHLLINGLARAGLGSAEFVGAGERMEGKVVKLIKAGVRGFVRDYKVSWLPESAIAEATSIADTNSSAPPSEHKPDSTSFFDDKATDDKLPERVVPPAKIPSIQPGPFRAPPLYAGSRYIAFAILDGNLPDPATVKISGVGPDGPIQLEIPVGVQTEVGPEVKPLVHTMAARKLVQDMMEGTSWMHAEGVSVDEARIRTEVVRIGKTYGIASKYTSYVAVQVLNGEEKAVGLPEKVIVPSRPDGQSSVDAKSSFMPPPPYSMRLSAAPIAMNFAADLEESEGAAPMEIMDQRVALSAPPPMIAPSKKRSSPVPSASAMLSRVSQGMKLSKSSEKMEEAGVDDDAKDGAKGGPPAAGGGGLFGMFRKAKPISPMPPPPPAPVASGSSMAPGAPMASYQAAPAPGGPSAQVSSSPPTTPEQILLHLISLQKFNGSFPAAPTLFSLSPTLTATPPSGRTPDQWATACAIAIMEVILATLKEEWELVAEKAQGWLEGSVGDGWTALVEEAKKQIGNKK